MIKVKKERKKRNLTGKGIYDKIGNFIINPTVKLRPGEMHVPMWNKEKKKIDFARFSGPGTDLLNKLKEGIQPLNKADRVATAHDIRYSLSNNIEGIKEADKKMVDKLKELRRTGQESTFNTLPSQLGIQANQLLAKVLPNKAFDWFVQKMTGQKEFRQNLKPEDRLMLQDKLKELEKEGYGKKKKKKNSKRILKK